MKKKGFAIVIAMVLAASFILSGCNKKEEAHMNKQNNHIDYIKGVQKDEGMDWPEGQVLPTMAKVADELDAINISSLRPTLNEEVTFSYLQGHVNKKKPRLFLRPSNPGEGTGDTWPENLGLKLNLYSKDDKYELLKKYMGEVDGIVLYDKRTQGEHYINLACTVAGIKNALPVDVRLQEVLLEEGINLNVVEDLTKLEQRGAIEIYTYMYETYWKDCTKRLLFSLSPASHKYYVRDMAAATGAAVIWLDNQYDEVHDENAPANKVFTEDERNVSRLFLKDMEPGKSMVTGWYTEERSGIGLAAEYGLSTVPSDYFENSTVYAGMDHEIVRNEVPNKPELENKIYVAIFMSDGDNVQYCQHSMYSRWTEKNARGEVPINWTISPSLVDFAPGMLNYYYSTATENDFFASGPSGLGYSLLIDELNSMRNEKEMVNLKDADLMAQYAKLSQIYQEKAGFRVITCWDTVNAVHMEGYEKYTRYLYGATYQNWENKPITDRPIHFINDRLTFIPNTPCYAMSKKDIMDQFTKRIEAWDGNSPLFLSAQGNVWQMQASVLKSISKDLNALENATDKVVMLRGDHFFSLLNEANGKPFDLTISEKMTAEASSNSENAVLTIDGNPTGDSIWEAGEAGEQWIKFDLGGEYIVNRYVIRHAGSNGKDSSLNTKAYIVEVSTDGENWTVVDDYRNNQSDVTDIDIEDVTAKFVRITVKEGGSDNIARIADVEIYGRTA